MGREEIGRHAAVGTPETDFQAAYYNALADWAAATAGNDAKTTRNRRPMIPNGRRHIPMNKLLRTNSPPGVINKL